MRDLRTTLHLAAAEPSVPPDVSAAVHRGRHLRVRSRFIIAACGAVAIGTIGALQPTSLWTGTFGQDQGQGGVQESAREEDMDAQLERVVINTPLTGKPIGIARGAGSVWVTASQGQAGGFVLLRLEEATGVLEKEISLPGFPEGVEFKAPHVWVITKGLEDAPSFLHQIDSRSSEIAAELRLEESPVDLVITDQPWVALASGAVVEVHEDGGRVQRRLNIGADGMAAFNDSLWIYRRPGRILPLDPDGSPSRVGQVDLPLNLTGLEVNDQFIAATQYLEDSTARVSIFDRVEGTTSFVDLRGGAGKISLTPEGIWTILVGDVEHGGPGSAIRIDPKSAKVLETVEVGKGPSDLLAEDGQIWVVNFGDDTLSHVTTGP